MLCSRANGITGGAKPRWSHSPELIMAGCKKDRKLADDARSLRWWKAWHLEEREALLTGPHGVALIGLFRTFKNLRHVQPSQLIGFVGTIDWMATAYATRLVVLHEINTAIT